MKITINQKTPRALVVDDDLMQQVILTHMLEKIGFEVLSAKDGREGVSVFNAEKPDIIFLDIEMPVMNGIDAARIIQATPNDEFTPIIFITGHSRETYLDACLEVIADDYIRKPFNLSTIFEKARAVLRLKKIHDDRLEEKKALNAFKAAEVLEQETAAMFYENIVAADFTKSPNLRHLMSPLTMFNGDLLLCAYTPANKLHILLGDFTGHGITASVAAVPTAEIFYRMTAKGFSIREIAETINSRLNKLLAINLFLASTFICLDRDNRNMSVIACGLPEHFLYCSETGEISKIRSYNIPLGIIESCNLDIVEKQIEVRSSQRLIMFTDGVIEAKNKAGKPFGYDGVTNSLNNYTADCFSHILDALRTHQKAATQRDDITLVELSCDFGSTRWDDHHESSKGKVTMEASSWETSAFIDINTLKRINPVPSLVNSIMDIQGLTPFRASIFLVVTELFINSLEHGLLALDSSLKHSENGFSKFLDIKHERLNKASDGSIKFTFTHRPTKKGGLLTIKVQDTGVGFDESLIYSRVTNNQKNGGRGIKLIREICDSLEYGLGGRHAIAIFSWQND